MVKKAVSTTNAGAKKPRGKPFEKGDDARRAGQFVKDDPRRNNAGQRNAAAVNFGKGIRELIVTVGEEITTLPDGRQISKIEGVVRAAYKQAIEGDYQARNFIVDRVEGKATENVNATVSGTLNHEHSGSISYEDACKLSLEELADSLRDSLGEVAETKRRW